MTDTKYIVESIKNNIISLKEENKEIELYDLISKNIYEYILLKSMNTLIEIIENYNLDIYNAIELYKKDFGDFKYYNKINFYKRLCYVIIYKDIQDNYYDYLENFLQFFLKLL